MIGLYCSGRASVGLQIWDRREATRLLLVCDSWYLGPSAHPPPPGTATSSVPRTGDRWPSPCWMSIQLQPCATCDQRWRARRSSQHRPDGCDCASITTGILRPEGKRVRTPAIRGGERNAWPRLPQVARIHGCSVLLMADDKKGVAASQPWQQTCNKVPDPLVSAGMLIRAPPQGKTKCSVFVPQTDVPSRSARGGSPSNDTASRPLRRGVRRPAPFLCIITHVQLCRWDWGTTRVARLVCATVDGLLRRKVGMDNGCTRHSP